MRSPSPGRSRRPGRLLLLAVGLAVFLSGCSLGSIENGFLPGDKGVTNKTESIINHWNGSWIAALAVGVLVWGLTIWSVIVYRKRKDDNTLPVQLRYHVPLELLYTVVPIIMVGVLFFYATTVFGEILDESDEPDTTVHVYGKQWSWDFNYVDEDVYSQGGRVELTGEEGVEDTLPTLYLPVGENVQFILDSRDVNHAFWIPAFIFKLDVIPGQTNSFQLVPEREGHFQGKCAELCGEYHSAMLFNVEVVDRDTFDDEMQKLRDEGNVGFLGDEYNRDYSGDYRETVDN